MPTTPPDLAAVLVGVDIIELPKVAGSAIHASPFRTTIEEKMDDDGHEYHVYLIHDDEADQPDVLDVYMLERDGFGRPMPDILILTNDRAKVAAFLNQSLDWDILSPLSEKEYPAPPA